MRFKEFFNLTEDGNSTEQGGLMGYGVQTRTRKPSDGQPFKDKLSSTAGDKGPTGGPGPSGSPMMGAPKAMFMKKSMKKL